LYDLFATTKSYGVEELRSLGCRKVIFVGNAFDPNTHRPVSVSPEERMQYGGAVGFIGTWEAERAETMNWLAANGCEVRIWGNMWNHCPHRHASLVSEGRDLIGATYAKAICAFDINLCFLRKLNRDLQTTRSVEIPACGAFMLAERTEEHLQLFEEGAEAEFFSSRDELLDKIKYYLAHPSTRSKIATAGRQRCLRSGYSYHERIRTILAESRLMAHGCHA
jgi:spore maturation protein CgeB